MELSPTKREILEALLIQEKPVKAAQLAKEMGKEFPATQMHLIGKTRMGYAQSPQKANYFISLNGKKALELPEVTKEKALTILASTPSEKAFHFYMGIDKPLNVQAHDLLEFCDKLNQITLDSFGFHLNRGDFEAWFQSLGDEELAKKTVLLKEKKKSQEEMRQKLYALAEGRCMELAQIVGKAAPIP
jgi:hypothetical protein